MIRPIYAAGAVCWRVIDERVHVLVIHRTRHRDVSLPKGKVDPGETLPETAVREVFEETGLEVALGIPLGTTRYSVEGGRAKVVHYWAAEVTQEATNRSTFLPNGEVAALEWLPADDARDALSYARDQKIVDAFLGMLDQGVRSTFALIALRHGKAMAHGDWTEHDATRPLTARGAAQAKAVIPLLQAWRPRTLLSSPAVRCLQTLRPAARAFDLPLKTRDDLGQDQFENGTADLRSLAGKRVRKRTTAVLCTHGPVLPVLIREIALATATPPESTVSTAAALETGAFSVVHLSASNPASGIIAIETHAPLI